LGLGPARRIRIRAERIELIDGDFDIIDAADAGTRASFRHEPVACYRSKQWSRA
jgi:hypothetical protein